MAEAFRGANWRSKKLTFLAGGSGVEDEFTRDFIHGAAGGVMNRHSSAQQGSVREPPTERTYASASDPKTP